MACLLSVVVVQIIALFEGGSDEMLHERRAFWLVLSGIQVIISLITFSLAIRLMCLDPNWGADSSIIEQMKKIEVSKRGKTEERNPLDISADNSPNVNLANKFQAVQPI